MALVPNTRLGPYEIFEEVGAGGMGEVYRARDTRLDRTVAIKVLPDAVSKDNDVRQRFEREARAISALQHPNICTLFDIGAENGIDYLVMEYLEGETLAHRLERGPIALKELVKTGSEIAHALDKAHKQGIIHRDLKPGNIMLTKSGAKLLDFGLAKPLAFAASSAATKSVPSFSAATMTAVSPITQAGTVVGTVQYMSPEQIEGKEADARSDIFALGCVLYEMATGRRAFEGKSNLSIASSILEKEPEPITAVQPLAPPALDHVIRRCLEKSPDDRWQSAADVAAELRWTETSSTTMRPLHAPHPRRRTMVLAGAAGLALLVGLVVGYLLHGRDRLPLIQAAISPPAGGSIMLGQDNGSLPMISADGSTLVFTAVSEGRRSVFIRPIGSAIPVRIPGTDDGYYPFWSPDGRSLGFFSNGKLRRVDIDSGIVTELADAINGRGGAWNQNGVILYAPDFRSELYSIPAVGGTPKKVTALDAEHTSHRWPQFLPDGEHFVYSAINHNVQFGAQNGVYLAALAGGTPVRLVHTVSQGQVAGGYLFYLHDQNLVAQTLKGDRLEGGASLIASGVQSDPDTWTGAFSVNENGALAYQNGPGMQSSKLEWYDDSGHRIEQLSDTKAFLHVNASRDGRFLAADVGQVDGKIWVGSRAKNTLYQLTFSGNQDASPVVSPDGKSVVYAEHLSTQDAYHFRLVTQPFDGAGAQKILTSDAQNSIPLDWSQDGKYILFAKGELGTPTALSVYALADGAQHDVLHPGEFSGDAVLSPDGRWICYTSSTTGNAGLMVSPVDLSGRQGRPQGRWQVGDSPVMFRWSADGKSIFYADITRAVREVRVDASGDRFDFGPPKTLFTLPTLRGLNAQQMVVTPDRKFLFNTVDSVSGAPIIFVSDWRQLLKK